MQEKQLKNKLQDEREKRKTADSSNTVSFSEHASIVAQLESERAQAHAEVVEAAAMLPESKFPFLISSVPYKVVFPFAELMLTQIHELVFLLVL